MQRFRLEVGTRASHVHRHPRKVRFSLSPKERRIRELVLALDRDDVPMAETWRLVGNAAANLGLRRPGYHLVRTLARESREARRARAQRQRAELTTVAAFFSPRVSDVYVAAERAREARRAEALVLNQHKRSRGRERAGRPGLTRGRATRETRRRRRSARAGRARGRPAARRRAARPRPPPTAGACMKPWPEKPQAT